MLITSQHFAPAAPHCLEDAREIAIAQVQQQFLQRARHLDERMSPGIGLVQPLLEIYVFHHIFRMFQRELQFMALHREDTAVSFRGGLHATRKMGRIC